MRAVARILIVGGGCRGRLLSQELVGEAHAVRVTTRRESARGVIEGGGAECWIGAPQRMGTLRAALEGVSLACWLLASASGEEEDLRALHGSLLERFVHQLIDTTVRGFVYEAAAPPAQAGRSRVPAAALAAGAKIARDVGARNAIPVAVVEGPLADDRAWLAQMHDAVRSLLGG
jgi:uncharacterized protein YbjT (DUF2867 family)